MPRDSPEKTQSPHTPEGEAQLWLRAFRQNTSHLGPLSLLTWRWRGTRFPYLHVKVKAKVCHTPGMWSTPHRARRQPPTGSTCQGGRRLLPDSRVCRLHTRLSNPHHSKNITDDPQLNGQQCLFSKTPVCCADREAACGAFQAHLTKAIFLA